MEKNKIYHGNNLDILKTFADNSIDSIVTDPPYGISFMNKKWDYDVPSVEFWKEALRVLKPGGHALVACGTRTQHRMAVNLEDAGFEIRDIVAWVYGSGFPKSHDISKAIDKMMGAEREVTGKAKGVGSNNTNSMKNGLGGSQEFASEYDITAPSTDQAKQWQGWGTALKPAMELWTLCRKPLQGTVAQNVLKYGVGGINIDGCRIATDDDLESNYNSVRKSDDVMGERGYKMGFRQGKDSVAHATESTKLGRFPANFIHDGSEEVVKLFPNDNGSSASGYNFTPSNNDNNVKIINNIKSGVHFGDSGSAARFFYTAKASQTERNWGLGEFEEKFTASAEFRPNHMEKALNGESGNPYGRWQPKRNIHPTVKPIDLMRYLVRLITPKGGVCLDPFMGSGTTAVACKAEKFNYVGCELEEEYIKISEARIKAEVVVYDIFDYGA